MTPKETIKYLSTLYRALPTIPNQPILFGNVDIIRASIYMAIKALEQTEWIPVSERLPKESGKYLVTFGGMFFVGIDIYTSKKDAIEIFGEYYEEYIGWNSRNVVAWMPFPEPYKAESEI